MSAHEKPIAVVTGVTSGIGRWTAEGLLNRGFRVIGTGRDAERVREAIKAFARSGAPRPIEIVQADFADLQEVKHVADVVRARAARIDLLINNAGTFPRRRETTRQGHERALAVNHLAPFLLTRELLPLLAGGRVVNVGSSSSDRASIDPDDLQWSKRPWSTYGAYAQSKLALMIASFEWARRLGARPVVHVVHPGAAATRIGEVGGWLGFGWQVMKPFLLSPEAGARTTLYVATSEAAGTLTGRYFKRCATAAHNPLADDLALAARIWTRTEELIGEHP